MCVSCIELYVFLYTNSFEIERTRKHSAVHSHKCIRKLVQSIEKTYTFYSLSFWSIYGSIKPFTVVHISMNGCVQLLLRLLLLFHFFDGFTTSHHWSLVATLSLVHWNAVCSNLHNHFYDKVLHCFQCFQLSLSLRLTIHVAKKTTESNWNVHKICDFGIWCIFNELSSRDACG